ncbi:MAG: hypothetical protein R2710_07475 [Acidimicrobiales bacterium]
MNRSSISSTGTSSRLRSANLAPHDARPPDPHRRRAAADADHDHLRSGFLDQLGNASVLDSAVTAP